VLRVRIILVFSVPDPDLYLLLLETKTTRGEDPS
jgi:hypothetical protein